VRSRWKKEKGVLVENGRDGKVLGGTAAKNVSFSGAVFYVCAVVCHASSVFFDSVFCGSNIGRQWQRIETGAVGSYVALYS
jgi:hypothetical protein